MSEQPRRRRRQQNVGITEITDEAVVETAIVSPDEPEPAIPQKVQYIPTQNKPHTQSNNEKNIAKNKGRKRVFISVLLAFIVIVGAVGIFLFINGGRHKYTQVDISAINVAQDGHVVVLKDKAYYIENQQTVWESDLKFTKGKQVFSDEYIYLICADENAIYYSTSKWGRTPKWEIHKFDLSTKQQIKLTAMEDEPELLSYSNNRLFYIKNKALYAFDLNTQSEKKIVSEAVETFTCAADGIYYATWKSYIGSIYKMNDISEEPELLCELPVDSDDLGYDLQSKVSIDQLFVINGKIFVRKRFNLDGGWIYKSVSYQIDTRKNKKEWNIITTRDIHAQIPSPDGKGCYYILALNDENEKTEYQRYFSQKNKDSTYLGSFSAGRLAYSPYDSDWIDELTSDYRYYCCCYYSNEGLIMRPNYSERYVFYSFDQTH